MKRNRATELLIIAFSFFMIGCWSHSPEAAPTAEDAGAQPDQLRGYKSCLSDNDCGAQRCQNFLGASVCVTVGCAADESLCGAGETCVVSPAIEPAGICAKTGRNDFCGTRCGDPLRCALDPDCVSAGCCQELREDGCPAVCEQKDFCSCLIEPICPEVCCYAQ